MIYVYFHSVCQVLYHYIRDLSVLCVEVKNVKCFKNMVHVILHLKEPLGNFQWLLSVVVPRDWAIHIDLLLKEGQVYWTLPLSPPACSVVPIITAMLVFEIVLVVRLPNMSFFIILKFLFLFLSERQSCDSLG